MFVVFYSMKEFLFWLSELQICAVSGMANISGSFLQSKTTS